MSKLVLKNVTRRYGVVEAVADFSLELVPGEFVSLLGPSGCGKTTTLRTSRPKPTFWPTVMFGQMA